MRCPVGLRRSGAAGSPRLRCGRRAALGDIKAVLGSARAPARTEPREPRTTQVPHYAGPSPGKRADVQVIAVALVEPDFIPAPTPGTSVVPPLFTSRIASFAAAVTAPAGFHTLPAVSKSNSIGITLDHPSQHRYVRTHQRASRHRGVAVGASTPSMPESRPSETFRPQFRGVVIFESGVSPRPCPRPDARTPRCIPSRSRGRGRRLGRRRR